MAAIGPMMLAAAATRARREEEEDLTPYSAKDSADGCDEILRNLSRHSRLGQRMEGGIEPLHFLPE